MRRSISSMAQHVRPFSSFARSSIRLTHNNPQVAALRASTAETAFIHYPAPPHTPFSRYLQPDRHCGIVGAPFAGGQPLAGVDLGPNFMRKGGLIERLNADNWRIHDVGDVEVPEHFDDKHHDVRGVKRALTVGAVNKGIFDRAQAPLSANHFLLTLGGDHSIGVGSIAAVLKHRPDTGVVWIDAHADINTPSSSSSGNPHGMVLSFLMDLEQSRQVKGFEWMDECGVPLFDPSRLVYIGLRDLDEGEKAIIRHLNIKAYTMHDVDKYGIGNVCRGAVDHLTHFGPRPLHLSLDIDSIDPLYAPSTGTRVAGGLTYREAYYICEALAETNMLTSMDMVEVNPMIEGPDQCDRTVQMAIGLIASAMGNRIL